MTCSRKYTTCRRNYVTCWDKYVTFWGKWTTCRTQYVTCWHQRITCRRLVVIRWRLNLIHWCLNLVYWRLAIIPGSLGVTPRTRWATKSDHNVVSPRGIYEFRQAEIAHRGLVCRRGGGSAGALVRRQRALHPPGDHAARAATAGARRGLADRPESAGVSHCCVEWRGAALGGGPVHLCATRDDDERRFGNDDTDASACRDASVR